MLSPARLALLLAGALVALAGCAETVRSQRHPALSQRRGPIRRIAVAPFSVKIRHPVGRESAGADVPSAAAALAARYLAEALGELGYDVVPPEDVHRALFTGSAREAPPRFPGERAGDARPIAWTVGQRFGADAVVMGQLYRYRARRGSDLGAIDPASVGFEVTLHAAPGGERLWSGVFDETQRAVSENLPNAFRYPGGGARWLTAEEILRWGAREVAREMPGGG